MLIVHCDASTAQGWSGWCYTIANEECKGYAGLVRTNNSAAAENIAATKAIERFKYLREDLWIITDSLNTVNIINNKVINGSGKPIYLQSSKDLLSLVLHREEYGSPLFMYKTYALHINSKNEDRFHRYVDETSRAVLFEYLKMEGK